MTRSALIRFVALAAIWGASFLFMRILTPVLGGFWTAEARLAIGGIVLLMFMLMRGIKLEPQHWQHYVVIGLLNTALPLTLFCLAAGFLPAGYSAVLNSSVPMWATLFGAYYFNERITPIRILALLLGVCGVIFVTKPSTDMPLTLVFFASVAACLTASAAYALNAIYMKKRASHLKAQATSTASHLIAALVVLPLALVMPHPSFDNTSITPTIVISALGLGVFCSGIAFLMYYQLIQDIGVLMTGSVTFLVPLFAIFWGRVVLGEQLGWHVFAGCALIISGAFLLYRSNLSLQKVAR